MEFQTQAIVVIQGMDTQTGTVNKQPMLFICHTGLDEDYVADLAAKLEARGIRCWYYERDNNGSSIGSAVDRALDECECLLFVMSKNLPEASTYIQNELNDYARTKRKVIPLRVKCPVGWWPSGARSLIGSFPVITDSFGLADSTIISEITRRIKTSDAPNSLGKTVLPPPWSRRMKNRIGLAFLIGLALLSLFGAILRDAFWPISVYYADYVDNYGLPEGIFEVHESDVSERFSTWRFDFKGYYLYSDGLHKAGLPRSWLGFRRKPMRIVRINSKGVPKEASPLIEEETQWPQGSRPSIQDVSDPDCWDGSGRLMQIRIRLRGGEDFLSGPVSRRIVFRNRHPKSEKEPGHIVPNGEMIEYFSETDSVWYQPAQISQSGNDRRLSVLPSFPKTKIAKRALERDGDRGRATKILFFDLEGNPTQDATGLFGFEFDGFDSFGRPTRIWNLGEDGRTKVCDSYGCQRFEVVYRDGVVAEERFMGGKMPAIGRPGFAEARRECDKYGNTERFSALGPDGLSVLKRSSLQDRLLPDPYNLLASMEWSDCYVSYWDGLPTLTLPVGPNTPNVKKSFNDTGDLCGIAFIEDWKPVALMNGIHAVKLERDSKSGFVGSISFFSTNEVDLVRNDDGVAKYRIERDGLGSIVRLERYDENSRLTRGKQTGTSVDLAFFENGRLVKQCFFDEDLNPCSQTGTPSGVTIGCWTYEYDSNPDNLRYSWAWIDSNCTARVEFDGKASGIESLFDEQGRQTEMWYVDKVKTHVLSKRNSFSGVKNRFFTLVEPSRLATKFRHNSRLTGFESFHLDHTNGLVAIDTRLGIFGIEGIMDETEKPIQVAALDEAGKRKDVFGGSIFTLDYSDETRESFRLSRLGATGAPTTNSLGLASFVRDVDRRDHGFATYVTDTLYDSDQKERLLPGFGFSCQKYHLAPGFAEWSFWFNGDKAEDQKLGGIHHVVKTLFSMSFLDKENKEKRQPGFPILPYQLMVPFWSDSEWAARAFGIPLAEQQ